MTSPDSVYPVAPPKPRWWQEPLLHFVLIGALLYAAYHFASPRAAEVDAGRDHRIVLTQDDLVQMTLTWRAQGRPMPTAQQMGNLIEARVREEVLFREALALGLDKDDTIVKRRLAQKMDFLAEDLSTLAEPTPQELKTWFEAHPQRFALPPRLSFRHHYFSPDKRAARAFDDARRALPQPDKAGAADAPIAGDPFMFQDRYVDQSAEQLAALFGPNFARALVESSPGRWQGPVESGYGWHLVFVEEITPGRVPAFEEIEPQVKREWIATRRAEAKQKMYETLRARYEVVVAEPSPGAPASAAASGVRP
jgi:hypothetical protein